MARATASMALLILAALCLAVTPSLAGQTKPKRPQKYTPLDGESNYRMIVGALTAQGSYKIFLKYLNQTGLMVYQLNTASTTVFAPSDAAFKAAKGSQAAQEALKTHFLKVTLYHVAPQKYKTQDLVPAAVFPSLVSAFSDLNDLHVFKSAPSVVVGNSGWKAKVSHPDILDTPLVSVHGIDKLLIPLALQH